MDALHRLRHPRFAGIRSYNDARDVGERNAVCYRYSCIQAPGRDPRALVFTRRSVLQTAR
jgi:hypothetical protein